MKRRTGRLSLILAAALCTGAVALTPSSAPADYPKPREVPVRWELDFKSGPLRLYIDAQNRPWWYFTYEVINRTGRDRVWAPLLVLYNDQGEIIRSGTNVPLGVTNEILDLLGNPLLMPQNQVIGNLLQGPEHAVEGLAVWPANFLNVTEMNLFISGISGETAEVANPKTGERVIFQKTLQIDYVIPGDPLARGSDPVSVQDQRWIMR